MASLPQRIEPSAPQAAAAAPARAARQAVGGAPDPAPSAAPALSLPLGGLALLLLVFSVSVAGLVGYGVAVWVSPLSPWMVALASGIGVVCAAVPLGLSLLALARKVPQAPEAEQPPTAAPAAAPQRAAPQGLVLEREHFNDMVAREWSRARRYGTGAALLLVDIDRYSRLTDALGVGAGEKVLSDLLAGTAPTLRGADALAAYEAGQFAVFLAHADATGALDVAERIRERAEQTEAAVAGRRVRFTVSVGVAHLRPAHLHLQALLDDVIDALGAARTAGGNCVRAAPVDASPRQAPGPARDGSRADKK